MPTVAELKSRIAELEGLIYKPDAERRQWFIGDHLAREGSIRRGDIMETFGVSTPQASKDIQVWLDAHPGAMSYDTSAKRYVRAA